MAMTKAEQSAAARRIMGKSPMTAEEKVTFDLLSKKPEDYRVPGEGRECGICGEKFQDKVDSKGNLLESALAQFSDHQAFHNPTADKWATAHDRIQAGKEKAKEADKKAG